MSDDSGGCSCSPVGCVIIILAILFLWAVAFGLPTHKGVFNIDLFPPYVGFEEPEKEEVEEPND